MSDLPESIGVLTFNPKTDKNILNILKDYFKCMPMLNTIDDSIYILPNTKTIDAVLNNMYDYCDDYLDIDIFRGAIYKYNPRSHTYDIINSSWYKNVLPSYIRVHGLNTEKLGSFVED